MVMMKFSEKLKRAMQELEINQAAVVGMTGKSKASISQYLSDKQTPSADVQRDIAVSLGLEPDYFDHDDADAVASMIAARRGGIKKMTLHDAARLLHVHTSTVAKGLQQGVFPWGYAIKTDKGWAYVINAERFAAIEGVEI